MQAGKECSSSYDDPINIVHWLFRKDHIERNIDLLATETRLLLYFYLVSKLVVEMKAGR